MIVGNYNNLPGTFNFPQAAAYHGISRLWSAVTYYNAWRRSHIGRVVSVKPDKKPPASRAAPTA